jgi:hypothetical protein
MIHPLTKLQGITICSCHLCDDLLLEAYERMTDGGIQFTGQLKRLIRQASLPASFKWKAVYAAD